MNYYINISRLSHYIKVFDHSFLMKEYRIPKVHKYYVSHVYLLLFYRTRVFLIVPAIMLS